MKLSRLSYPLMVVALAFWIAGAPLTAGAQSRQLPTQPNYDPPQPSADFGTPEATAKIAATAEFLDLVGVKLGMPLREAIAALMQCNDNFEGSAVL